MAEGGGEDFDEDGPACWGGYGVGFDDEGLACLVEEVVSDSLFWSALVVLLEDGCDGLFTYFLADSCFHHFGCHSCWFAWLNWVTSEG